MIDLLSIGIAFLFSTGVWLCFSRDWLKIILGLSVLGHGANLFILRSGGGVPDPVPQALILTAIVIGMGTTAVLLALAINVLKQTHSRDVDFLQEDSE